MERERLLREIRARLEEAHGDRLAGVVLYGSEARGDAREDSDVDLLVLLKGPVRYLADLRRSIEAVYPLVLEIERPIHPDPVDVEDFEAAEYPLYREARAEGITA
jgi:predicted nucleotidyltransferase